MLVAIYHDNTESPMVKVKDSVILDFGLVGFYGISTLVAYLIPNPLFTHTQSGLVCWVLWHINICRSFNTKSIFM